MKHIIKKMAGICPEGFIVGGVLRDSVLGLRSKDIDIVLPRRNYKKNIRQISALLRATAFVMDKERDCWRINSQHFGIQIDISPYDTLEDNSRQRDFTINALYIPFTAAEKLKISHIKEKGVRFLGVNGKTALDFYTSIKDIKKGIIKQTHKDVLTEDALRLLRALRFRAKFNFKIDKKLFADIKKHCALINNCAGERIQDEILKILRENDAKKHLAEMQKAGLLFALFPVLKDQIPCAPQYYGKGGVLGHTFKTVERLEYLLNNVETIFPAFYKGLARWRDKRDILKLCALLHDIAKPATAKIINGRLRFFLHDEKGAQMAEEILRKLKFSNENIKIICEPIRHHLRIGNLSANETISNKALYRFFKDTKETAVPLLLLCWADNSSYVSPSVLKEIIAESAKPPFHIKPGGLPRQGKTKTLRHLQVIHLLLKTYFENPQIVAPVRLLGGNDVMKICGLPSSPKVGEVLEKLSLAQAQGKVKTKDEAIEFVKKLVR